MHNIIYYNRYKEEYYIKLKPIDAFDDLIFISDIDSTSKLRLKY